MSRNTIEIEFADGSYTFALPLPRIHELEAKTSIGIGGLYSRMVKGVMEVGNKVFMDPAQADFHASDIIETIRQGLIGGGKGVVNEAEVQVTATVANRLIVNYVLTEPLYQHWSLAVAILGVCVKGYDPPKKAEPAEERAEETPETGASTTA